MNDKGMICGLAVALTVFLALSAGAKEALFFVGAHPDDSEGYVATAFLLKEKYDIHVIDLTRGEMGLGRSGFVDGTTGERRIKEEEKACALLGAKLHFLDEIDGFTCAGQASVDRLASMIEHYKPVAIFTHWPVDVHADHVQCAAVTCNAVRKAGWTGERYFFEVSFSQTRNYAPTYFVDVTETLDSKLKLIRCYECQNKQDSLVRASEARAKLRGRQHGVVAAETFTTYEGMRCPGGVLESLAETRPCDPRQAYDDNGWILLWKKKGGKK